MTVETCARPCATCAFRPDSRVLGTEAALRVLKEIDARPFLCHESLIMGRFEAEVQQRSRLCAGAEAVREDLTGRLRADFVSHHEGVSDPRFAVVDVVAGHEQARRFPPPEPTRPLPRPYPLEYQVQWGLIVRGIVLFLVVAAAGALWALLVWWIA